MWASLKSIPDQMRVCVCDAPSHHLRVTSHGHQLCDSGDGVGGLRSHSWEGRLEVHGKNHWSLYWRVEEWNDARDVNLS